MQRFILKENIAHFERDLTREIDARDRHRIHRMLLDARRDLAILESNIAGIEVGPRLPEPANGDNAHIRHSIRRFRDDFESSTQPYLIIDPHAGLHILDINRAYAEATMTASGTICGLAFFDVFPDNPGNPEADGVSSLFASLQTAVLTRCSHTMALQRYDIRDPTGTFVERYWRFVNTPIFDDRQRLVCLLHNVEDVTNIVLAPATTSPFIT